MAHVSFDDAGKDQVAQLHAHINGPLLDSLNGLTAKANTLAGNNNFQGRFADQYRGQVHPDITKTCKKMHDDCNKLSQELKQIGDAIMRAGGSA